ncbi:MAG: DUF3078 domain-containing protein [Planctomycetia bacterium]|nr:DUF3078 domain-containing protein [Planctomycetia bacterium]
MNKTIVLILLSTLIIAQETTSIDTTWQKELVGSFSFNQAYFDNWIAGGENALAHQFDLVGKLIYSNEKYVWTNTGKIAFGNSKIGEAETKKTIDELRIESLLTYFIGFAADPYLALKGETQLAPGYIYGEDLNIQVSGFLDPGYFTQSAGLQYSPNKELSVRFGFAVKETVTKDFPDPYTDDSGTEEIETTKIEPGLESVLTFSKKISESTLLNSKIDLFNNFTELDATDIRWDTDITAQVTKYINVKFNVKLFYDKDISPKRQISQSLLLGISYTIL